MPLVCTLALLVASIAADARAEPSAAPATEPPEVVAGREAFTRGAELARRGVWVEALAAFEDSARLRGHPITTYNVAFSERALGRLTRARGRFVQALTEHAEQRGGTLTPELALAAEQYAAELDEKILRVEVTVDPADTAIAIDDRPLEPLPSATGCVLVAGTHAPDAPAPPPCARFTLEIDPGEHTIVLRRAGAPDLPTRRVFDGDTTELLLRGPAPPPEPAPVVPPTSPPPRRPWARPTGLGLIGGGAALTVAAATTGALFLRNRDALRAVCFAGECPSDRAGQIDRTNALGVATWVLLGAGVGALGVGAALAVVGRPRDDARRTVALSLGPRAIGLAGRF